ncbi:MAG: phosphate acyltransferase PlsX [Chloroflexi bacterium]|nr:phosphate acyltransferase PlsX [Chloroflexota bacterium]
MGGDAAPAAPIMGALEAARDPAVDIIVVGPQDMVSREVDRGSARLRRGVVRGPRIVDAPELIDMAEHPVRAIRAKRRSSIVVGLGLVAAGEADAFVTAGNTGAAMAGAVFVLKRIEGIDRPALATPFPTTRGVCLLLDVGANADARAHNLVQFAIMGAAYAERALGMPEPRVGLLNIGEEESKGSLTTQEAYQLLRRSPVRFVGNVEGKDILEGAADVVVTDGFVGNVLIKFAKGVAANILGVVRSEIRASPLTTLLALGLMPVFGRVRRRLDYAEYGGAPLLGVNGVCIIAHGRSNARAIRNAIRVARASTEQDLVGGIRAGLPDLEPGAADQGLGRGVPSADSLSSEP